MKKVVNILSILFIVLILAQTVIMFLPNWTMTPVADRLNPDPQPENYSIMNYCWTDCATMNKVLEKQFKADYDAKYVGNDYVIGLVLSFVFGLIAATFSAVKIAKSNSKIKSPAVSILCNCFSLAWAYFALTNFLGNFILVLGTPMVRTLLICVSIPAAVVVAARLVLDLIIYIKEYRAEYCV